MQSWKMFVAESCEGFAGTKRLWRMNCIDAPVCRSGNSLSDSISEDKADLM